MLTHYLKIAFRNLWKNRAQSLTAILGLAFAVACLIPALYWMRYETSYDHFYPQSENIYRMYTVEKPSEKVNSGISKALEQKLRDHFPVIETSTSFMSGYENCKTQDVPYIRPNFLYADSTFFSIFPQTILSGETQQPLQVKNDMVLTESLAIRLFGDVNKAIGQQVQCTIRPDWPPYNVTAVIKDFPQNSNIRYDAIIYHDMLISFSNMPENMQWNFFPMEGYLRFAPEANIEEIEKQLPNFIADLGVNDHIEVRIMPISKVRHELNADVPFTLNFIQLFILSGALLLFAAVFNFMNFYIDLFSQRHRELHLRMVNGAGNGQLVIQMLIEQTCAILLALFLGVYLIMLIRPIFRNWLSIQIDYPSLLTLFGISGITLLAIMWIIGLIAFNGISRFAMQPASVRETSARSWLRHGAITLQLAVSILFIVSSLVVMQQLRFVNQKDLGIDKDGVIQISGFTDYSGKVEATLIQELAKIPQVECLSDAYFQPKHTIGPMEQSTSVEWDGKETADKTVFHLLYTDEQFAKVFRLNMLAGNYWEKGQTTKVILNEEAVRVMGLKDPIGSIIRIPSLDDVSKMIKYEVAGVVKDFHTLSLRNRISPTILVPTDFLHNLLYVRVVPGEEAEAVQRIMEIIGKLDPTLSEAKITSVGDLYTNLNQSEEVGLDMFSILAVVSLLLSLFGIYAISVASTYRRKKEIAVRKVMGAEIKDIVRLFFREYVLQVIISGIIALPLAYWIMVEWLQGYAYRITISAWLLCSVLIGTILVVLLTVFSQIWKAANGNPARVISMEN